MSKRTVIHVLFTAACDGDRASGALAVIHERGGDDAREIGRLSYPLIGDGYTVGITGAPEAGKSTLTSALIAHLRAGASTSPCWPLIRRRRSLVGRFLAIGCECKITPPMRVFIRSMAASHGDYSHTSEAMRLLDAVKYPYPVETSGRSSRLKSLAKPTPPSSGEPVGVMPCNQQGRIDGDR